MPVPLPTLLAPSWQMSTQALLNQDRCWGRRVTYLVQATKPASRYQAVDLLAHGPSHRLWPTRGVDTCIMINEEKTGPRYC